MQWADSACLAPPTLLWVCCLCPFLSNGRHVLHWKMTLPFTLNFVKHGFYNIPVILKYTFEITYLVNVNVIILIARDLFSFFPSRLFLFFKSVLYFSDNMILALYSGLSIIRIWFEIWWLLPACLFCAFLKSYSLS